MAHRFTWRSPSSKIGNQRSEYESGRRQGFENVPRKQRESLETHTLISQSLRDGDESPFSALMRCYHASMLQIALLYVADTATAEDVIQETWIGVLRGLDRFEGRSSLKTWIFTILTNRAKTRAMREGRYVSLSMLLETQTDDFEPAIASDRFNPSAYPASAHHWPLDNHPNRWDVIPEDCLLTQETMEHIHAAIRRLPPVQQRVILMRYIEGCSPAEVCEALSISETNQRVLLHRARASVRRSLASYLNVA